MPGAPDSLDGQEATSAACARDGAQRAIAFAAGYGIYPAFTDDARLEQLWRALSGAPDHLRALGRVIAVALPRLGSAVAVYREPLEWQALEPRTTGAILLARSVLEPHRPESLSGVSAIAASVTLLTRAYLDAGLRQFARDDMVLFGGAVALLRGDQLDVQIFPPPLASEASEINAG